MPVEAILRALFAYLEKHPELLEKLVGELVEAILKELQKRNK